jgi:CheY-like chemotaxis protein
MKPYHILLAEDDENDVFFLRESFKRAGIENPLEVVKNGQEAIDYLSGKGRYADRSLYPLPCLIILDLQMPRRTGMEVLEWLREQSELRCLPVIIHSGSAQESDVDILYQKGANAFVVKPASMEDRIELANHIKGFWLRFNEPPTRCTGELRCGDNLSDNALARQGA